MSNAKGAALIAALVAALAAGGCRDASGPGATDASPSATDAGSAAAESASGEEDQMPRIGDLAPDFTAPTADGTTISLSALRGRPVVLYFYPKDDTPGCTKQACGVRDQFAAFEEMGAVVLGVSLDDVDSHRKFRDKYQLPFPLVADTDHAIARAYGVLDEYRPPQGDPIPIARRVTFLIDADGKIAKVWDPVDPTTHAQMVLDALRELGSAPAHG